MPNDSKADGLIECDCCSIGGVYTQGYLTNSAHLRRVANKPLDELSTNTPLAKTGIDIHPPYHSYVRTFTSGLTMQNGGTDEALAIKSAKHYGITRHQSPSKSDPHRLSSPPSASRAGSIEWRPLARALTHSNGDEVNLRHALHRFVRHDAFTADRDYSRHILNASNGPKYCYRSELGP